MGEPTIHTVAAAAGVATSTVSRALSNPDRVSDRTREKVERVARELGYAPQSGRSRTKNRTVAVVVADISNPFYFDVIRGTQLQLRASDYSQLLIDTEESGEIENDLLHRLRPQFDGAILAASRMSDRDIEALAAEFPIVVMNRTVARVPSVVIDTASGMTQALEHLVSLGHSRVCYVSGPNRSWANALRWKTLVATAERLSVEVLRVGPFAQGRAAGAAAADAVVNSKATGCIAYNDLTAIGMLARFAERGVAVPQEVSVVGCDDIFGADFCSPALTTITTPIEQAGRSAVALLVSAIESRPGSGRDGVVLPTHLTIRDSTGVAP
jgi:LacI family transcriptional regulator